jgi:hypothetical protein
LLIQLYPALLSFSFGLSLHCLGWTSQQPGLGSFSDWRALQTAELPGRESFPNRRASRKQKSSGSGANMVAKERCFGFLSHFLNIMLKTQCAFRHFQPIFNLKMVSLC